MNTMTVTFMQKVSSKGLALAEKRLAEAEARKAPPDTLQALREALAHAQREARRWK